MQIRFVVMPLELVHRFELPRTKQTRQSADVCKLEFDLDDGGW